MRPIDTSLPLPEAFKDDKPLGILYRLLNEKPSDFVRHEKLIAELRTRGPVARPALDGARRFFAQRFPLPPVAWRQWVLDLAKDVEEADEDEEGAEAAARAKFYATCEQALRDYQARSSA